VDVEQEAAKFRARRFGRTTWLNTLLTMANFSTQYEIRKVDVYMIGNSNVIIDDWSDVYVNDRHFRGTKGPWELLTRKKPNTNLITAQYYEKYRSILLMTSAH
jgi:hypothetical protein